HVDPHPGCCRAIPSLDRPADPVLGGRLPPRLSEPSSPRVAQLGQQYLLAGDAGVEMDQDVPRQCVGPNTLDAWKAAETVFDLARLTARPARQVEAHATRDQA